MEFKLDDTYFMKKALQEAEIAMEKGEVPIGAVIVVNERVIARAHNLTEQLHDVTAHAEMQAITAAANFLGGKYLYDCTLYVTLEPCQMCAGALYWSQIPRIVYGATDPQRGFNALGAKLHPKTQVIKGVLEEESDDLLKRFFIQKRNLN
ncbi:MAG: nucleoside deaminase [Flavobacteriaceae bacterium]|nr:nucleoside deaminase [Flavobacteriaceae bacterium]MDH3795345.1 nucleoside deaminase [Flavobacteriaceae bacterium]